MTTNDSWHSYPSIFNLGHKAVADLFSVPVRIEEKIDGSQFSFGLFEDGMRYRSKGAMVYEESAGMFKMAVESAKARKDMLKLGYTYRGEYVMKPKHNTLAYGRIPKDGIIIFDINDGHESYLTSLALRDECDRIGLEHVPALGFGLFSSADEIKRLLDVDSILGGTKIEGVVIKPSQYELFGQDKKVLMGKYVSEMFKEIHGKEWKAANPGKLDIIDSLVARLKTDARWEKAVQHLREKGVLQNAPQDIGALIAEVQADIEKECAEEIRDALYKWGAARVKRGASSGVAEWYKERLLKMQFEKEEKE